MPGLLGGRRGSKRGEAAIVRRGMKAGTALGPGRRGTWSVSGRYCHRLASEASPWVSSHRILAP